MIPLVEEKDGKLDQGLVDKFCKVDHEKNISV